MRVLLVLSWTERYCFPYIGGVDMPSHYQSFSRGLEVWVYGVAAAGGSGTMKNGPALMPPNIHLARNIVPTFSYSF